MRLVVVVENRALRQGLMAEHGLSLWLEGDFGALLYDTGAGRCLMPNLAALGLDPAKLDGVILSHGHYDHTGGLGALLKYRHELGLSTRIWCHRDVFASHLAQRDVGLEEIGPPLGDQTAYQELGAIFNWVEGPSRPWPGVTLLAPVPRQSGFEGPAPNLFSLRDGQVVPDPFDDDLAVILESERGPWVLTGCAHAGVINVLQAAEEATGKKPVFLLGGTHLGPAPKPQQEEAVARLKAREGLIVAAGHCTGSDMEAVLARSLGERFVTLGGGLELEL